VQLRAIQEVWDLSSLDVETLGKLAGSLMQGIGRLNQTDLSQMSNVLKGGQKVSPKAQSS